MRKLEASDLFEIGRQWRARAQAFMREAKHSRNPREIARLASMSSTLVWCTNELCLNIGVDPGAQVPASTQGPTKAAMNAAIRYRRQDVARAFGLVLRAAREAQGMSQDQLSETCDMDRTYPSLLERGLRGPTVAMLLRLADALGVEPGRLVAETVMRLGAGDRT